MIQWYLERKAVLVFHRQEHVDLPALVAKLGVWLQSVLSLQHQDGSEKVNTGNENKSVDQFVCEMLKHQTHQMQVESRQSGQIERGNTAFSPRFVVSRALPEKPDTLADKKIFLLTRTI